MNMLTLDRLQDAAEQRGWDAVQVFDVDVVSLHLKKLNLTVVVSYSSAMGFDYLTFSGAWVGGESVTIAKAREVIENA